MPEPTRRETTGTAASNDPPLDSEHRLSSRDGGRQKIGRYEVHSRLGRGGMGTVYLVRLSGEGGFSRPFALKVLRSHLAADRQAILSLRAEARIASKLNHANVVSIVDVGSYCQQPYVVMEYVHGPSLSNLLAANSRLASTRLVVTVLLDALAGLSAVHTASDMDGTPLNIIHHDISPHNFLVGVDGVCRLTDFGIAAIRDRSGNPNELGKPGYMSPERIVGKKLDPRSDVFSLGVLMWTALTGAKLFEGRDTEQTLKNVLNASVPPPSAVSGSPKCLDALCLKALSRNAEQRFSSALEMASELRQIAAVHNLLDSSAGVSHWVRDAMGGSADFQFEDDVRAAPRAPAAEEIRGPNAASIVEPPPSEPGARQPLNEPWRQSRRSHPAPAPAPDKRRPETLARVLRLFIALLAVAALLLAIFAPE